MRFQREEVGFYVCHSPQSFKRIILVLFHVMIQTSYGASLYPLTEAGIGRNAKFEKSYLILETSVIHGC